MSSGVKAIFSLIVLILCVLAFPLRAQLPQQTGLSGIVVDAHTGESLSLVNIFFAENNAVGTASDDEGQFSLISWHGYRTVIVSCMGYASETIYLAEGEYRRGCVIRLENEAFELERVVVKSKRSKYKRKGNPAVDLVLRAIANRSKNKIAAAGQYEYDQYERVIFSENNFRNHRGRLGLDSLTIAPLVDSSYFGTLTNLPVSLREKITKTSLTSEEGLKERVLASRLEGIDEWIDEGITSSNIEEILRPIDVYAPDIPIFMQRIPSPLSSLFATSYYKYYIQDTVMLGADSCIHLSFSPSVPRSAGFVGSIWLTSKELAVRRLELDLPSKSNVNWLDRLHIEQEYRSEPIYGTTDSTGMPRRLWVLAQQDIRAVASAKALFIPVAIEVRQTRVYTNYLLGEAAKPLEQLPVNERDFQPADKGDFYWLTHRPVPLPPAGHKVESLMAGLKKKAAYRALSVFVESLVNGYFPVPPRGAKRSLVDIGPLPTFLTLNRVEGFRLRVGGMTTASLCQHVFLDGFLAYGFKDRLFKWRGSLTYTPLLKEHHPLEFPRNNFTLLAQRDLYGVSHEGDMLKKEDIFSLIWPSSNTKRVYRDDYQLSWLYDWSNSFTSTLMLSHQRYRPGGTLEYQRYQGDGSLEKVSQYSLSELMLSLRWEPWRVPYKSRKGPDAKDRRVRRGPTIALSHRSAFAGFLGSDYSAHQTELTYEHRLWLSFLGHIDLYGFAGIHWNASPYPMLKIPIVNESVYFAERAYKLMRVGEYVADRWAGLLLSYHMNGLVLDRIPYVNVLGLRGVVSANIMWGDVTKKNLRHTPGLFEIPSYCTPMQNTFYAEMAVGIENILKIFRVDYFYRLTQQDKAGAPRHGVRLRVKINF